MIGYGRTALLLAALTALFMGAGYLLGGSTGMVLAFVMAGVMNLGAWWFSDKMVLAQYGAKEVSEASAPQFYGIVRELAQRAGLPMPKVYVMESAQPNAFATGRNPQHAAVCATTGLLQRLSRDEIRAVMAHELAHVKHRDTLIMTMTATIAGALSNLASMAMWFGVRPQSNGERAPLGGLGALVVMVLGPVAAALVQFAISRSREFEADRLGAEMSGDPLALASALANLHRGAQRTDMMQAEANPASAHLFIVNPLHLGGVGKLFATHPPMEARIQRLRQLATEMGQTRRFDPPLAGSVPSVTHELESTAPRKGPWG